MSIVKKFLSLLKMKVLSFLVVVIFSSAVLILINYFTIRTTSAVRAYINGESQYSKGQKDAARNLILYLNSEDSSYWNEFVKELSVPLGDSLARIELMKNGSTETIKKGFSQGRNKPEDLDEMIWLFLNFKNIPFMKDAIGIWQQADQVIGQVFSLGEDAHQKVLNQTLTELQKKAITEKINRYTTKLTQFEREFSDLLGATARRINVYLFYFNLLMTLFIIGSASAYAAITIKQLREKNQDLIVINQEMDRFVYSASHDLRAPISSMKGLVDLASREQDVAVVENYLKMMTTTLNKQDQFIREIIDFSRNKKTGVQNEIVSLEEIIELSLQHHLYMPGASNISIEKKIDLDRIQSDSLRLKIVINNIISNAIKYSDTNKSKKFINICTFKSRTNAVIEISDNGIGIDRNYLHRIYEMFFVTDHNQNGSGLGLYITKETVVKMGGSIKVESEKGVGSKFIVSIPAES